ncbi:BppU family phage baseplate upper protein [Pediococcus acidilactici]|uniref:BppU family phage baseplate upper protein n=1 Tax=Pediococcus acidilactici TaxID=1254 RepID=A0AAW8YPS5_PEDAC|nr:BppU family phage baseplate upper protein [Pediococcus acidilactici]MDV2912177.1 BppU family phage baseplate upper protein [Pediococcus acidilactici]WQS18311.1 BppU family phage baseplate upper protein [Pediococcus acidilactici]
MSMYLTFTIGKDKRNLVDDITDFHIDNSTSTNPQWLQARQNEDGMRQVFVTVKNEDGSPLNLTGCNYWFQGKLPDGIHKIIDARHGVTLDAQNGKFRFDMPKQAFAVAGSYVQAFFRIVRDGESLTTLEFDLTVLADLVYNDLVPSDYITPFEDLYGKLQDYITKANGDFDAAMAQWKKDVADLITELNADIGGINLTITEIKAQLASLEEKIKGDGLLTQADFDAKIKTVNETIKNALDQLKKPIPVGNSIIIGGPISSDEKNLLDKFRSTVDTSKFNLIFFNDSHYGMQSDIKNYGPRYAINHLNTALYLDDLVNVIVAGGDNIDGHLLSYDGLINDEQNFATELLFGSPNHADKFALKGNHDDGSLRLRWYREGSKYAPDSFPDTISNAQFKSDYMNGQLLFGEHRNDGDSNYFYKDYPDFKVRLIGLDSNDIPEDVKAADGGNKYVGLNNMGYRQEQLDWFANVALQNVPEDYVTIICVHSPATPTANDNTNLTDYTITHYTNQAQLNQIIKDFINGQSSVITNNVEDWEIKVQTNFVVQGKRDVAGYIHGHYHYEELTTNQGFNNISCVSAIPYTGFNNGAQNGGWTLFTLDRDNRKLKSTGYGLSTNRTFDY